ncbi:protein ariadne-1, putative [Pediculus humanus corporis]|uniref:RBR-type E3 ubiquitin transferase n=1 Tax=Pediculus humanus subsp. corporis TaxID=121224 RepID=E0VII3_PEDHC|nr:protein ariadne-1, putative [Pediculus humanus corporis]EEB13189.1 protein ariadne-1, putative [Pediculus humanus corporis]
MGSSSSKFKKYLHHGDEFAAMQVFQSSPELQKNLNPNLSYGEHYNHDTALHFAAKHGMKHLLRTFLNDLGGNPNVKNGNNETSLHSACQLTDNKSFSAMERRAHCVSLIIQWRGLLRDPSGKEKINLAAQDQKGNTALHIAAASGLESCVTVLVNAGSPLFLENNDKMTPCDLAVKNGQHTIAQLLETNMVFGDCLDFQCENESYSNPYEVEELYCGLRTQDLQEAKDQLLVQTSDMLQVPLFTAEALLRNNEWSREMLLEKWMKDAVSCCNSAGVEPPQSAFNATATYKDSSLLKNQDSCNNECEICMLSITEDDKPSIKISCNHNFCFQCWEMYLSNKILEGIQHNILCPAFNCHILVPNDVIERLVSPDLARRYLHFDIKFLLECLGEAHAPSGCTQWKQWLEKVNKIRPEQLSNDMKNLEDASNCLWLVSNSKPCPNCKSPIQKNEGCNHIKCSKCKFDFCWVCLEAWKKHSSATGGYFRCNRFPAAIKADEKQEVLINEAVAKSQRIQELNRFLHYYTRFKNHEHSRKIEESLLNAVKPKMEVLASSLVDRKSLGKTCTKFVEDGVRELLKARRVLSGSYVYGFYLEDHGYNKTIYEFMQNELEVVTEKLSEMIARPYLITPRHTIIFTTLLSRRKRHEFVQAVSKGLIPPETPPSFRKKKKKLPGFFVLDTNNEV